MNIFRVTLINIKVYQLMYIIGDYITYLWIIYQINFFEEN